MRSSVRLAYLDRHVSYSGFREIPFPPIVTGGMGFERLRSGESTRGCDASLGLPDGVFLRLGYLSKNSQFRVDGFREALFFCRILRKEGTFSLSYYTKLGKTYPCPCNFVLGCVAA